MSANRTPSDKPKPFDIDFDKELPPQAFFPVWQLARMWHCSVQHVFNLISEGSLKVPLNLRSEAATKTTIRVPRSAVIEFLNRRKMRQP